MFKKKWALCWDGPCRRRTPRRNPDGRRHPSGPHGGRLCRLRFPWRCPRFLLSSASRPGPACIAGARAGFAIGAAGPRSCPQSNRTRLCVDRLARRAISGPFSRSRSGHPAGRSQYLCSARTMYRILEDEGESRERRDQLVHPAYQKPELLATAPNQLWSWDITKLRGAAKWTYFYRYVILDVFSRYVTGWMVAPRESAELAKQFIEDAIGRDRGPAGQLTIHV